MLRALTLSNHQVPYLLIHSLQIFSPNFIPVLTDDINTLDLNIILYPIYKLTAQYTKFLKSRLHSLAFNVSQ